MESLRGLPSLPGASPVGERSGGRRQADAFRRALQQGTQEGDAQPSTPGGERPVRRTLQLAPGAGRKNEGTAHHVDVIA